MSSRTPDRQDSARARRVLTAADKVLVVAVAAAATVLLAMPLASNQPGARLGVEVGGRAAGAYNLAVDQRLRIPGAVGFSEVVIAGNAARVSASPCREQLCVRQGWIRHRGEVAVCLPNQLVLQIDGGTAEPSGLDAVSR